MPQSLSAVNVHLVFSTKGRRAFLKDETLREAMHAQFGAISKQLDCPPLRVGGVEDHVHILARLGRSITQSDWVKELKRVSNGWIKEHGPDYHDFQWQAGYAAFSVSHSAIEGVKNYIASQREHHLTISFQDELRSMLRAQNMEFDERYLWD